MSRQEQEQNIILIELEPDAINENRLRLDLNVVFNPISVRRGHVRRADFYIGCSGAEVLIEAFSGEIDQFTEAHQIDVEYENRSIIRRKSTMILGANSPTLGSRTKAPAPEIRFDADVERSSSATFLSAERMLDVINTKNRVRWVIALPRGEKVFRDFLFGNLVLYAECSWLEKPRIGSFMVRPSEVGLFDSDRRPLGAMQSLMMRYTLWKKGIKISNEEGLKAKFAISGEE